MASLSLDGVLNQLNYKNRGRVHADALNVINATKSLSPKVGTLTHNNGAISRLLLLTGTFPIYYQSAQYNIPVDIYLPEQYPESGPIIYLRPTSTMVIKHGHQHVDSNGVVYLPYLHEWRASCCLSELLPIMSSVFSIDPPMFSRPAGSTASPVSTAYPASQAAYANRPAYNTTPTATPSPVAAPQSAASLYMRSVSGGDHAQQSSSSSAQPATGTITSIRPPSSNSSSSNKAALIQDVTVKMQEEIHTLQSRLRNEIDDEFRNQKELSTRQSDIAETISHLQQTKDRLLQALSDMQRKREELSNWVQSKENEGVTDPETRIHAYDPLSQQLIRLQAEHNANEDAMYYLEKALMNDDNVNVDLVAFLREIRKLARKQFVCEAHMRKIVSVAGK